MTSHVIFSLLSNDPGVSALVGNRIFPATADQGVQAPYIVFREVSATPSNTKKQPSKLDEERWQIDNYDSDYDRCEALAANIRTALDYKSLEPVKQIRFSNDNGNFDNAALLHRRSADYTIRKNRS